MSSTTGSSLSNSSWLHSTTSTPVGGNTLQRRHSLHGHPVQYRPAPSTPPVSRASPHVESMLSEILLNRNTKQNCDIIAKSVLFLKTKESALHSSEYEITPSVQFNKISPFDELRQRSHCCRLARDLIEFVAQEKRHGYLYDSVFLDLRREIIYTSNNLINAYYNCHCTASIDQLELAIQCVHLACKTQSTFKRLEKLVLAARNCFHVSTNLDRQHFAAIEMDILQSTGFQLEEVEDYPHKYIYKFKPKMASSYDVFRASEKKMMTLCHCAILLATKLVEAAAPVMLNRNSPLLAAACLYISNNFNHILNIKEWWKNIEGCEHVSEKLLQEESDLVFDAVKHSENNWTIAKLVVEQQYEYKGTASVSSPPQQMMMSPMSLSSETNRSIDGNSSGFDSASSKCPVSKPKIETQVLQSGHLSPLTNFIKSQPPYGFTYKQRSAGTTVDINSCSASTCSSGESNSVKAAVEPIKPPPAPSSTLKTQIHHPDHIQQQPTPPSSQQQHIQTSKSAYKKPEQIPFRKCLSTGLSPLIPKSASAYTPSKRHSVSLLATPGFSLPSPTKSTTSSDGSNTTNNGMSHKLERNYKNRLTAILCCEEITRFYAASKARYATLTRNEKNIVKDFKNKVKRQREQKKKSIMGIEGTATVSRSIKRRRHSELLPSVDGAQVEKRQRME